jgi:S-adenosylmethionine/arginine decarboxylase-like enzyme
VIDAWCAEPAALVDPSAMASVAQLIAESCEATVLQLHTHRFEPTGGLTLVAILSASHVAIHTWPEYSHLTVDLIVCDPALIHVQTVERAVQTSLDAVSGVASLIERPMVGGQQ